MLAREVLAAAAVDTAVPTVAAAATAALMEAVVVAIALPTEALVLTQRHTVVLDRIRAPMAALAPSELPTVARDRVTVLGTWAYPHKPRPNHPC